MRITHLFVRDIRFTDEFYTDLTQVTDPRALKALDKYATIIASTGHVPRGMQAHKAESNSDLWIGYLGVGRPGWRLLFYLDEETREMIWHRVVTHREMDLYLKGPL